MKRQVIDEDPGALRNPGFSLPWQERRASLREQLKHFSLPGLGQDEWDVHFSQMPAHYWERVTPGDLVWGLETIHGFLKLVGEPGSRSTTPFVNWRQDPGSGYARAMICTWDRHGLLAKCAACCSAVKLNILRAEAYTRADNVVLDVFHVGDADDSSALNPARFQEMTFLLDGALSNPPRFASLWACSRHKILAPPPPPPRVSFDNSSGAGATVVLVEAPDRLGLLSDILQAIADSGLNVTEAHIETVNELARDIFHITDAQGLKIIDPAKMDTLRAQLEASLIVSE